MEVTPLAAIIAALLSTAAISILPNFLLFLFPNILTSDHKNAQNILSLGEALAAGALAAKVTGAGGGGCILALFPASKCDESIAFLRQDIGNERIHPLFIP
jgi:hypothetical protein